MNMQPRIDGSFKCGSDTKIAIDLLISVVTVMETLCCTHYCTVANNMVTEAIRKHNNELGTGIPRRQAFPVLLSDIRYGSR